MSRIKNLENEGAARLEAASASKEELRGQINRIKETIRKKTPLTGKDSRHCSKSKHNNC